MLSMGKSTMSMVIFNSYVTNDQRVNLPSGYLSHSHGKWPIEIDGLPINSMVIFHGYVSHNQRVYS